MFLICLGAEQWSGTEQIKRSGAKNNYGAGSEREWNLIRSESLLTVTAIWAER